MNLSTGLDVEAGELCRAALGEAVREACDVEVPVGDGHARRRGVAVLDALVEAGQPRLKDLGDAGRQPAEAPFDLLGPDRDAVAEAESARQPEEGAQVLAMAERIDEGDPDRRRDEQVRWVPSCGELW
ncbi:MAG: hypothetical protein AB7J32_26740 [Pseudonocardia sp.]